MRGREHGREEILHLKDLQRNASDITYEWRQGPLPSVRSEAVGEETESRGLCWPTTRAGPSNPRVSS